MSKGLFRFLSLLFCVLIAALPSLAAQSDIVHLDTNSPAQTRSIPGRIGNDCVLDQTQYQVELSGDPFDSGALHLRAVQNVDLYVRRGDRVAVEGGKIIADIVSSSSLGIEDIVLDGRQAGTYFVAVSNCSEAEAVYAIGFRAIVDLPDIPRISECGLSRDSSGNFSLTIIGGPFYPGTVVLMNNEAVKRVAVKKQQANGWFSKIVATGRICRNLPGNIIVATPNNFISQPFGCTRRCTD